MRNGRGLNSGTGPFDVVPVDLKCDVGRRMVSSWVGGGGFNHLLEVDPM